MVTLGLPVSTFVDIRTQIESGGVSRLHFGRGLLITTYDALSAGGNGKAKLYLNPEADWDTGDALNAATVCFSADPIPQGLSTDRCAIADVATTLRGGAETTGAQASPLNFPNASFTLAGNDVTANLSGANTYAAIATTIETLIVTYSHFATFAYDANRFLLMLAGAQVINPAYFGTATTGDDIGSSPASNCPRRSAAIRGRSGVWQAIRNKIPTL